MKRGAIERMIVRMLLEREMSGYDIYKELMMKGAKLRSNYLYMILGGMHDRKLLNDRWVEGTKGPKRHLHSLSRKGEDEFRMLLKESVGVVMDAFVRANLSAQDLRDHSNSLKAMFDRLGVELPGKGTRLVMTTPSFDPLLCYPIAFYILGETFPNASIFVIKPPEIKFQEERSNLTFLDGWRHDIPLKNRFADYLMLEGFPKNATEKEVISECSRVLKEDGHFIIRHPSVMTEEKKPKFGTFGEFASRLFYDISDQDRIISVEWVKQMLAGYYEKIRDDEQRGNIIIYASDRKVAKGLVFVRESEILAPVGSSKAKPARMSRLNTSSAVASTRAR